MMRRNVLDRLKGVGILSLLALFFGGTILIFVGMNGLLYQAPDLEDEKAYGAAPGNRYETRKIGFRVGNRFGLQQWLAIIGAGFGCLSFGFLEAYYHAFDWWCSRQALQEPGLDYARYLNTQSRAPVLYSVHRFPLFATLRYLIIGISLAASIGYKFGVVQTQALVKDEAFSPGSSGFHASGSLPGLARLEDKPYPLHVQYSMDSINQRFHHRLDQVPNPNTNNFEEVTEYFETPPSSIILLGKIPCFSYPEKYRIGGFITQELVVVANMTEDTGVFQMRRDKGDWERLQIGNWTLGTTGVVDYRIEHATRMQIQWAPVGEWLTNSVTNISQPVHRRLAYEVRYATAEVRRMSWAPDRCGLSTSENDTVRLLSIAKEPIPFNFNTTMLPHKWIDIAMNYHERFNSGFVLQKDETKWAPKGGYQRQPSLLDGVSAFVRVIMAELHSGGCSTPSAVNKKDLVDSYSCDLPLRPQNASDASSSVELVLPPDSQSPFSAEATRIRFPSQPDSGYPHYEGLFVEATGCYRPAAIVYIMFGIVAILVAAIRIWVGPPLLTSWTGQHIYLSSTGVTPRSGIKILASGYQVAPKDIGRLRLFNHKLDETGQIYEEVQM
ncbi:hypothetical protein HJFPF1_08164 [Paramyrothecium foliicola]|nr:hypothetical protein HJFPF1_08164 [Paramyrothecium foliicola]